MLREVILILQHGCVESLDDLGAPVSWPVIAYSSKAVKPRVVDHYHRQGELGLAQVGHVGVPPVVAKVVPLAGWNGGCVSCEAAAGIDVVTDAAETVGLPRCAHVFSPFHDTCVAIESECFVREAGQTPVLVGFLGRATACKEGVSFEVNDLSPVLLKRIYRKRLSKRVIVIRQVVETELGCLAHPTQPRNSLLYRILPRHPRRTRRFAFQLHLIISKHTHSPIISRLLIHLILRTLLRLPLPHLSQYLLLARKGSRLLLRLPLTPRPPLTLLLIQRIKVALAIVLEEEHGVLGFEFGQPHLAQHVCSELTISEVVRSNWGVHILTQALQPQ